MNTTTIIQHKKREVTEKRALNKWERVVLLIVLAYEGLGGLAGGGLLIAAPDGRLMEMPVEMMNGVFPDFFVPGIILFLLGMLNCIAFFSVLRRHQNDWWLAATAMGGYFIWFVFEIMILQGVHWLHAMWGLPVVLGLGLALQMVPREHELLRKVLLMCGIVSSILYVALTIIVPMQWPEYNSASQTISELSAIDAPTRQLWAIACTPYTILMLAFAWGVLRSAGTSRSVRWVGLSLLLFSALGLLWPFAPMHLRETLAAGGGNISDTLHIVLASLTQLFFLLSLGIAAFTFGKQFRWYSIISFGVLLIFGILTFIDSPGIATNQPTPMIGVWERINIGVFMLWVVVLAVMLLQKRNILIPGHRYRASAN